MTLKIAANSNSHHIKPNRIFAILLILTVISLTVRIYLVRKPTDTKDPSSKLISQNDRKETPTDTDILLPSKEEIRLSEEWLPKIPAGIVETEWLVIIDRSEQKEYVFQNRGFFKSYSVSTGSKDRYNYDATLPIGVWRIGEKIPYSLGEIYGPKLMYLEWWNGESFEETLRALHGTNEPENLGSPTSMGCIYHDNNDILELYELTPEGTIVMTVE